MRQKLLIGVAFCGSLLMMSDIGVAYGQTCTASPSCTELGYTKTQSECGEDGIKCPFGNLWSCKCKPKCDEIKQNSEKACLMSSYDDGCGGKCYKCIYGMFYNEVRSSIPEPPLCSGYYEIKEITQHCEIRGWCKSSPDIRFDYHPNYDSSVNIINEERTIRCKCDNNYYGRCVILDWESCDEGIQDRIRSYREQCEATGSF